MTYILILLVLVGLQSLDLVMPFQLHAFPAIPSSNMLMHGPMHAQGSKITMLQCNVNSQFIANNRYSRRFCLYYQGSSNNNGSPGKTDLVENEVQNILTSKTNDELTSLLDTMSTADKYSLLLQSYGSKVLEGGKDNVKMFAEKMERLLSEMIEDKQLIPDDKCVQNYLDAIFTFCDIKRSTAAIRLLKAGGNLKVFGVGNGQMTLPVTKKVEGSMLDVVVPKDDREREIVFATIIGGLLTFWLSLQAIGIFNDDVHIWTTLYSIALLAAGIADVVYSKGKEIRQAAAGFERLILKDDERQAHIDAAAFLGGYILGLPCFPFKPDVSEAYSMVNESPNSLFVFKQPIRKAILANMKKKSQTNMIDGSGGGAGFQSILQLVKDKIPSIVSTSTSSSSKSSVESNENKLEINSKLQEDEEVVSKEESLLGLGRVLVWLLIPVAAEELKYGQTIFSDPRRCERLLRAMASLKLQSNNLISKAQLPSDQDDMDAMLQWAYFEATTIVKQYGDLIEDVRSYLQTGTSSVGECVLLVENKLT